eukprot:TRINITY_DN24397_c0_g1_i1.p1 TRINITY_DN24397_c0_g1~~TRINITY_DN24397_c0_g1_i1.p1  ORF type:complete len:389 (-),score=76.11 TRINITY_DN24397_c0_g1_i1:47-1141(-)
MADKQSATVSNAKPLAVPGSLAFVAYFCAVATAVGLRLAVKKYKLLPTVLVGSLVVQIAAIVGVPIFVYAMRQRSSKSEDNDQSSGATEEAAGLASLRAFLPHPVTSAAFPALLLLLWYSATSLDEPTIWRFQALLQLVSYLPLLLRGALFPPKGAQTISVRKVVLDLLWLTVRGVATIMLDRRLPRRSNDALALGLDCACGAILVLVLLRSLTREKASQEARREVDSLNVLPALVVAAVLAASGMRASVAHRWLPDVLWTFALYVDAFAMLPQLWMLARSGGVASGAVAHHIAGTFASRFVRLLFWWQVRGMWQQGAKATGWLILVVHVCHLLLLSDFVCYYLKALCTRGPLHCAPLVCYTDH